MLFFYEMNFPSQCIFTLLFRVTLANLEDLVRGVLLVLK